MSDLKSDPAEDREPSGDPPADEIKAQMRRILSSPEFAQSHRLQKFLTFVVEETLVGRADALKEYTIALEVFERDESFDPQLSSVVRVEASRLRAKLKQYYALGGRNDPIHLTLPTGNYVPIFSRPKQDTALDSDQLPTGGVHGFTPARIAMIAIALVVLIGASALFLFDVPFLKPGKDRISTASQKAQTYSIAVLPLRNLLGKPELDYFSDSMTSVLITSLAKQQNIRVISLTSAMAYKNVSKPIADIARELNVAHVVEGALLQVGKRIRISLQLVERATNKHIWAENYVRDMADVLAIKDDVTRRIVAKLSGKAVKGPSIGQKSVSSLKPAAQEAYLKGLFFRNKMTEQGFQKGIKYFKKAIEQDPNFAPAYSGMASCHCLLSGHGFELIKPSQSLTVAKKAVLKALKLDDSLAESHAFLGIIRLKYEWDWLGAEKAFRRTIELNPSYTLGRLFYSFFLEAMGRQDEAIRSAEAARKLDPLSLAANMNLGWQHLQGGRSEQARKIYEGVIELNAKFWGGHWGLGHFFRRKGNHDKAIAAFQKAVDTGGGHVLPLTDLGFTYAVSGKTYEARKVLAQLKALAKKSYVSPFNMATIHVGLADKDEAFAWLEKAYVVRSRSLVWLNVAKEYGGLRSDPRFKSLLKRIGLPE